MREIKQTSTNGRWGLTVVVPDDFENWPAKGRLTSLGVIEGHKIYQFDPCESGDWIEIGGDIEPIAGCKVVDSEDLQSSDMVTLLSGGDFYVYRSFGYKRRRCTVVAYKNGEPVKLPAAVMAAMGLIPTDKESVDTAPPPIDGALAEALKKVGIS